MVKSQLNPTVSIMESFTVELNQNRAAWSRPGEYEVQLAVPITINDGDALGFKMASIDSNITDQDTILIEQDQQLTITFSYYDVDYDARDKYEYNDLPNSNTVPWSPTYGYFAAYNEFQYVKLTELQMTIVGYLPPRQSIFGDGLVGGSFVIASNGPYSNINTKTNMTMYFTYIDQTNMLRTVSMTGSNAMSYPNPNPIFSTRPIFRSQPGTVDVPEGNILMELPSEDIIYRSGSLKFVGVKGYWPGGLNNAVSQTSNFTPGSFVPGKDAEPVPNEFSDAIQLSTFNFTVGTIRIENITNQSLQLDKRVAAVTLRAGRYEPQALAVQMTQILSDANGISQDLTIENNNQVYAPNNQLLIRTDAPENSTMIFTPIPETMVAEVFSNTSYVYQDGPDPSPGPTPAYYVGANTVALEYGVAGQVFQMTYCHMPLNDPADPGQQSIGLHTISGPVGPSGPTDTQYKVITAASGIAIHDLQPVSFWQDVLGLRNRLIVPLQIDENGIEYYTTASLMKSITMGFQGLGTFFLPPVSNGANPPVYPNFRKMTPLVPKANPTYINVTGQSRAIIGETVSVNRRGGYYLIEILNVFQSSTGGYIDDTENRRQISAIVSTQMDNNNSITGYQDGDCIAYTHRGLPYMISSAVVRILDPITKLPVTTLGPNNTVFLQIQKTIEQVVTKPSGKPKPRIVRKKMEVPPELR